jgi:nucleoside phosphorylase
VGLQVLVVAASAGELEGLGDAKPSGPWEASVVGIGLVAATVGTLWGLREREPRAVVLVGTCGAYAGSGLGIGDVVTARAVRLVEPAAVRAQAQFPPALSTASAADARLASELARAGTLPADVATTLAITVDDALAGEIARETGCGVEHLEAYGVAAACASAGVPFAAVLAVANVVGSRARSEWQANHAAADAKAARVVRRWLANRLANYPG